MQKAGLFITQRNFVRVKEDCSGKKAFIPIIRKGRIKQMVIKKMYKIKKNFSIAGAPLMLSSSSLFSVFSLFFLPFCSSTAKRNTKSRAVRLSVKAKISALWFEERNFVQRYSSTSRVEKRGGAKRRTMIKEKKQKRKTIIAEEQMAGRILKRVIVKKMRFSPAPRSLAAFSSRVEPPIQESWTLLRIMGKL